MPTDSGLNELRESALVILPSEGRVRCCRLKESFSPEILTHSIREQISPLPEDLQIPFSCTECGYAAFLIPFRFLLGLFQDCSSDSE